MRPLRVFLSVVLFAFSVTALAQSQVDSVRIDVELRDDGSAFVSERWVIDVDDMITEWYLGKENLGKMTISDLNVTDESGVLYHNEGKGWNIKRSRQDKARRCGIVEKSDGCEICWGIGSSGRHAYTVTYVLTGLVKGYSDADGFNYMFMTPTDGHPRSVILNLRKQGTILTGENTRVWGFRFKGETEVLEGAVKYWSTEPFSNESALVAMVAFDKGIFQPELKEDKSFEDVKKKAFKGSDYKKPRKSLEDIIDDLFGLFFAFVFVMTGLGASWKSFKERKLRKELLGGKEKDVDWFRDVPVNGNLRDAANIIRLITGSQAKPGVISQNLIAAYMTRLFYRGAFELIPQLDGDMAFKINDFPAVDETSNADVNLEMDLYNYFKEAAGSDSILQKKELKRWANNHGKTLYNWQNRINNTYTLKTLNAKDVREVYGLKKFLKDFTLIQDRGAVEVKLWNNYLIFASLYGIADQVYKDFKKVCPEYFTLSSAMNQFQTTTPVVLWNTIGDTSRYFNRSAMSYASRQSVSSGGSRWGGGGGSISWGGGGGFSGGGHSGGR